MCTDNTLDRMLQKVVQPDGYYLECTLKVLSSRSPATNMTTWLQIGGHSQTTWTRLSGWVVGQMSTIVHVKQVGGSSNVHVDKMPERLRTKPPKIVGKRKFFCQNLPAKIRSRPQHHRIQAIHMFLKLDYKSQKVSKLSLVI